MRRVFVDSGAFFAHIVAEDAFHATAKDIFDRATREHWRLLTTNVVVCETHALLVNRARNGQMLGIKYLESVREGWTAVERVRKRDEAHAFALLRAQADKTYSLCDALSFVIMERLGIEEAIAFDRHFREYGRFRLVAALAP